MKDIIHGDFSLTTSSDQLCCKGSLSIVVYLIQVCRNKVANYSEGYQFQRKCEKGDDKDKERENLINLCSRVGTPSVERPSASLSNA